MSVQNQIDRITGAVEDIRTAISGKGVAVPEGTKVDSLAAYVRNIPEGVKLPAMENPAGPPYVLEGREYIDWTGTVKTGSMTWLEDDDFMYFQDGERVYFTAEGYIAGDESHTIPLLTFGDAEPADVAEGKIFTSAGGYRKVGTAKSAENCPAPLGEKLYTFGVLSDLHLRPDNYGHGIDDFNRAIQCMQSLGAEFVGIAGDVGYDNLESELQLYKTAIDTYAAVPFYATTGNHDVKQTEAAWQQYVGHPRRHEFVCNGDVFLFLPLETANPLNTQDTPYGTNLTWVKSRLERYKGARIFLFLHFPPTGYSGLADGQYYGFSSASTEDDELMSAIMQTKNVVLFSGHTHYSFEVEETYDNVNVFQLNAAKTALVHVPSCCYPRNASSAMVETLSQGYIVEAYEQGVVLRGVDLVGGTFMPAYEYVFPIDNNQISFSNAIQLSMTDLSMGPGESVQVSVSLAEPAAKTVTISANNGNVSVQPGTLTFTEDFNAPQVVTITAAASVENNATALVTFEAEGLTSKTVSITLTEMQLTELRSGANPILNGAIYGGTHIGCQLDDSAAGSAKTFTITFADLDLKNDLSPVNINAADAVGTIQLIGDNYLTSTETSGVGNRGMSTDAVTPIKLIGMSGDAALTIASTGVGQNNAALKGDYEITNARVSIVSEKMPLKKINSGITIVGDGSFDVNSARVELLPSEYGQLRVNVDIGTPGSSAITITEEPADGYSLEKILVNGVEHTGGLVMPSVGTTMVIQGVFSKQSTPLQPLVNGDNQIMDGAVYGGTYNNASLSYPNSGAFDITIKDFHLTNGGTAWLMKGNPIDGTIRLIGDNSLTATTSKNRGLSSSSSTPIKLIGTDGAALMVESKQSGSAALKGDYEITSADVIVKSVTMPLVVVNTGVTLVGSGSFSINGAKVELSPSEHGKLRVSLGAATPGSSAVTITAEPDAGYQLSTLTFDGKTVSAGAAQTMPGTGKTVVVAASFIPA